jgi:hypothetical protein
LYVLVILIRNPHVRFRLASAISGSALGLCGGWYQCGFVARMIPPPAGSVMLSATVQPAAASHAACPSSVYAAPDGYRFMKVMLRNTDRQVRPASGVTP